MLICAAHFGAIDGILELINTNFTRSNVKVALRKWYLDSGRFRNERFNRKINIAANNCMIPRLIDPHSYLQLYRRIAEFIKVNARRWLLSKPPLQTAPPPAMPLKLPLDRLCMRRLSECSVEHADRRRRRSRIYFVQASSSAGITDICSFVMMIVDRKLIF
jgi:hypothetical protein